MQYIIIIILIALFLIYVLPILLPAISIALKVGLICIIGIVFMIMIYKIISKMIATKKIKDDKKAIKNRTWNENDIFVAPEIEVDEASNIESNFVNEQYTENKDFFSDVHPLESRKRFYETKICDYKELSEEYQEKDDNKVIEQFESEIDDIKTEIQSKMDEHYCVAKPIEPTTYELFQNTEDLVNAWEDLFPFLLKAETGNEKLDDDMRFGYRDIAFKLFAAERAVVFTSNYYCYILFPEYLVKKEYGSKPFECIAYDRNMFYINVKSGEKYNPDVHRFTNGEIYEDWEHLNKDGTRNLTYINNPRIQYIRQITVKFNSNAEIVIDDAEQAYQLKEAWSKYMDVYEKYKAYIESSMNNNMLNYYSYDEIRNASLNEELLDHLSKKNLQVKDSEIVGWLGREKEATVIADDAKIIGTAFKGNSNIQNIIIRGNIEYIKPEAFKGCTSLKKLIIPNTVLEIGESAFSDCPLLEHVEIGGYFNKLPICCFSNCQSLYSLIINADINTIGEEAFKNCKSLKAITLADNVEIRDFAFSGCNSLADINNYTLEKLMDNESKGVFQGTPWLQKVVDGDYFIRDGYLDSYIGTASNVSIPAGVTIIGKNAFEGNVFVKEVSIPDSVKEIQSCAFANCKNLTVVEVAKGIVRIENDAFKNNVLFTMRCPKGTYAATFARNHSNIHVEDI